METRSKGQFYQLSATHENYKCVGGGGICEQCYIENKGNKPEKPQNISCTQIQTQDSKEVWGKRH